MGLSFHDEESMVEVTTALHFQVASDKSDNSNSTSLGSVVTAVHGSEEKDDDIICDIDIQRGKDIDSDTHDNNTVQV